ncbi:WD repeat protein [Aspergillus foveolatus]|uniref:WD repeat protein n=1 Tax=Aspergillus foveolatus TaxID=210207 RepID=UPI003CCD6B02
MSTKDNSSPVRLTKRSRASGAGFDNVRSEGDRAKRRRTSTDNETGKVLKDSNAFEISQQFIEAAEVPTEVPTWTLSRPIAGHFTNTDPVLTPDEQYLFLGVETSVHVYSVATSRLFRVLEVGSGDSVAGYRLSSTNHDRLYIITLSGSVSEWDWPSNKQVAHWDTAPRIIAVDIVYDSSSDTLFSLRKRKDGKRELAVTPLNNEKPQSTVILETNAKVDNFRVCDGFLVVYGGACVFLGTSCSTQGSESHKFVWKEVKLASTVTCVDIWGAGPEFDLALGGADGSILIYHILGSTLKNPPRRLHWHRDPVTAVRWSKDGNYVLSGGHESVMVLWQLDTSRKQFLPHLSSPICNIVVSESGNFYAVRLADNRVVVLSARELQPISTITSLQVARLANKCKTVAVVHPQHPEQLLLTVPASHQLTQEGITSASASVLQTYDIRSGVHISRQALARTNTTTLNIGPDGSHILTPDIKHLSISEDGKWMATIDSWSPNPEDVEALNITTNQMHEVYLKFWRWDEPSSLWQLVTRIDSPHQPTGESATVLSIASRPDSHEFATTGSDGLLRLWRHVSLPKKPAETWKCRNTLDLKGYLPADCLLRSASVCFSEDGSVLAVSLRPTSTTPSLTLLVDVRSCSVRYSKVGLYTGDICAAAFLGCHLIVATSRSLFIWDTVNDAVRTIESPDMQHDCQLLAVNSRTRTFATASRTQKKTASRKSRKSGFMVRIFDIDTVTLLSRLRLAKEPVTLLSNSHSANYIIVDAGAHVQQICCTSKALEVNRTDSLIELPDFGWEGLFGRQLSGKPQHSEGNAPPMGSIGLASVFGDTPPFVLPPSRVVFCDLVKALSV